MGTHQVEQIAKFSKKDTFFLYDMRSQTEKLTNSVMGFETSQGHSSGKGFCIFGHVD